MLREQLRMRCPSSPWIDAQFKSIELTDDRGAKVICRRHDPSVFPPGGAKTLMRRCPSCEIFTPPNAFERGVCLDEREPIGSLDSKLGWGRSPSAVAIEKTRVRHGRLLALTLEPESTEALRREIQQAVSKARKAENRRKRKEKRRKPPQAPPTAAFDAASESNPAMIG
jgi:hypothetical protein